MIQSPNASSELTGFGLVTPAYCLQHRAILKIKEVADTLVCIRMGPAHKAVPDQTDAKGSLCNLHAYDPNLVRPTVGIADSNHRG